MTRILDDPTRFDAQATLGAAAAQGLTSIAVALDSPGLGRWRGGRESSSTGPALVNPADRPFRIASITKPFVAATLHRLAGRGVLDLRKPVRNLLSTDCVELLRQGGYDPGAITPEHLLSHTSGLVDHSTLAEYERAVLADPQRRWSRQEQIAMAVEFARPLAGPGEFYSYSDTGYVLLGDIVERATDRRLSEAVRRELDFGALGLAHTWWEDLEPSPVDAPPQAPQFHDQIDVSRFHASFDLYGGGGLVSTVDDLARFVRVLLDGTLIAPRALLSALRTPAARTDPKIQPWRTHGYLVATFRVGQRWVLGHTGAWGSVMAYCPDLDLAIAATVNRSGDAARAALFEMIDRLLGDAAAA